MKIRECQSPLIYSFYLCRRMLGVDRVRAEGRTNEARSRVQAEVTSKRKNDEASARKFVEGNSKSVELTKGTEGGPAGSDGVSTLKMAILRQPEMSSGTGNGTSFVVHERTPESFMSAAGNSPLSVGLISFWPTSIFSLFTCDRYSPSFHLRCDRKKTRFFEFSANVIVRIGFSYFGTMRFGAIRSRSYYRY